MVIIAIVGIAVGIDSIAKAGVEKGATYALGVKTALSSMDVGIFQGQVEMNDLEVSNPAGFDTPHFLSLGRGFTGVSLSSLMDDTVIVPELSLDSLSMHLERKGTKSNYETILNELKKFEGEGGAEKSTGEKSVSESKEGKKFIVRKVSIRDVSVEVDLLPIGGGKLQRLPINIEKIELTDVGSDSNQGVLLSELTGILTVAILEAVLDKAGGILPDEIAAELRGGLAALDTLASTGVTIIGDVTTLVDGQVKSLIDVGDQLGEGLKTGVEDTAKIVEHGAEALEEGGKEIVKGVEDAGKKLEEGLGGLFGPKEKNNKKNSEDD